MRWSRLWRRWPGKLERLLESSIDFAEEMSMPKNARSSVPYKRQAHRIITNLVHHASGPPFPKDVPVLFERKICLSNDVQREYRSHTVTL